MGMAGMSNNAITTMSDLLGEPTEPDNDDITRCVVRLRRTAWHDARGCHLRTDLTFLKRHCAGYNILYEDAQNMGMDEVAKHLTGLNTLRDGIYKVVICNAKPDWETGYVEEYDYRLVPFDPTHE